LSQVTSAINYDSSSETLRATVFTQTDPTPLGAGSPFEQAYAYARSNPLTYIDPSGLRATSAKECRAPNWRQTFKLYGKALNPFSGEFNECENRQAQAVYDVHSRFVPGGDSTTQAATTIAVNPITRPAIGPAVGGAVIVGAGVAAAIWAAVKIGDAVDELTRNRPDPKTTVWRSVDALELGAIEASMRYTPGPGSEGKFFYPTREQAHSLQQLGGWHGRTPLTVTSGEISSSKLSGVPLIPIAGEGPAWFIPNALLPAISGVAVWGPA
jgi:hypothetical protein